MVFEVGRTSGGCCGDDDDRSSKLGRHDDAATPSRRCRKRRSRFQNLGRIPLEVTWRTAGCVLSNHGELCFHMFAEVVTNTFVALLHGLEMVARLEARSQVSRSWAHHALRGRLVKDRELGH